MELQCGMQISMTVVSGCRAAEVQWLISEILITRILGSSGNPSAVINFREELSTLGRVKQHLAKGVAN